MHKSRNIAVMIFLCAAFALAGCSSVRKVEYLPPPAVPEDAHPAPIGFSGVRMKLPAGYDAGEIADLNQSFFCLWPYDDATRHEVDSVISPQDLKDAFKDTLEAQGYDITGVRGFEFDDDIMDEELRSEYRVGGRIVGADMDVCVTRPDLIDWLLGLRTGVRGAFQVTIEWTVFDALRRTTVYRTTTEGYAKRRRPNKEGLVLLLGDSFAMAAHNLGADPQFRDLIFFGKKPDGAWRKRAKHEYRPRRYDPKEAVAIVNPPLSALPFEKHAERSRRAAVMIQAGPSHGSGFFITKQGHILTNTHVVGDAQRVRVVTANKEEKLVAEVLRKDIAHDVALLKLEEIPEGFDIVTLPVRTEWPGVGETVYTLGAPLSTRLQDTVRRGIVSAHRKNYKVMGVRMDFIQSDAGIQGGNSGGPLLDENGNLVGFAHAGMTGADHSTDLTLNFFIPIAVGLEKMKITLE